MMAAIAAPGRGAVPRSPALNVDAVAALAARWVAIIDGRDRAAFAAGASSSWPARHCAASFLALASSTPVIAAQPPDSTM